LAGDKILKIIGMLKFLILLKIQPSFNIECRPLISTNYIARNVRSIRRIKIKLKVKPKPKLTIIPK